MEVIDTASNSMESSEETTLETQLDGMEEASSTQEDTKEGLIQRQNIVNSYDNFRQKQEEEVKEESQEQVNLSTNLQELVNVFLENGDLTDEEIQELQKMGLSPQHFSMLAESQKVIIEKNESQIFEAVGGEEVYREMQKFANDLFTPDEAQLFNTVIFSGNDGARMMAVLGLKAMYDMQNKSVPKTRIGGSGSSKGGLRAFSSQEEVINALNDKRYGRDLDYTREVDERRSRSQW